MKKFYLLVLSSLLGITTAQGIPANPTPAKLLQPDGTYLTVRLVGDEYQHHATTEDGYTVLKSPTGYYVYAEITDGRLVATQRIARNASERSTGDNAFLQTLQKNLTPALSPTAKEMKKTMKSMTGMRRYLRGNGKYDISKFRGLIILVEFNDCTFSRTDIHDIVNNMVNQKNYDGYMSSSLIPEKIDCTGSVRDYYYDNSMGAFDPQFDIVGPVKINYSKYDAGGSTNGLALAAAASKAADSQVDFSQYDRDGDGTADMVFFIYAGYGANFSGNNSDLVWPHASKMFGVRLDGVSLGRYACSTEMYGREGSGVLDGIGTICHEFSHVLGLPDEYDTDYASSGGQSINPATWSIMAGGSYRNKSRTPVGYTLYERYALGFANPQLIEAPGQFTLDALNTSNTGYRINSAIPNEFFLLENRQQTRWDAYLAGHGMIVTRVDSTNVDVWENNTINCNPAHNYLEVLRAKPQTKTSGKTTTVTDSQGDPFPGSGNVTALTNQTTPSIRSWTQAPTPLELKDIAESADGVISFSVANASISELVEDFEEMETTTAGKAVVKGKFCDWSLDASAAVVAPAEGYGNGERALGLKKKAEIVTSPINRKVTSVSFMAYNPTTSLALMRCYYSTDKGASWVVMKDVDGVDNTTVPTQGSAHLIYNIDAVNPCFKITETIGSKTVYCYIDDFTIAYEDVATGIDLSTVAAERGLSHLSIAGNTLTISSGSTQSRVALYEVGGTLVAQTTLAGGVATLQLPGHGVYIVAIGSERYKIAY